MEPKPIVDFGCFSALDLRVGRIVDCRVNAGARVPAYIVEVDFGALGRRTTSARIVNYDIQALLGRTVVGVVNVGTRRVAGVVSEFLLLGAYTSGGRVVVLTADENAAPGDPIG